MRLLDKSRPGGSLHSHRPASLSLQSWRGSDWRDWPGAGLGPDQGRRAPVFSPPPGGCQGGHRGRIFLQDVLYLSLPKRLIPLYFPIQEEPPETDKTHKMSPLQTVVSAIWGKMGYFFLVFHIYYCTIRSGLVSPKTSILGGKLGKFRPFSPPKFLSFSK